MSLSNLIRRKSEPVGFATATLATFATQEGESGRTVASVATVAVAKPPQRQTAPPAIVTTADPATVSRLWLLHYPDRNPVEVSVVSGATRAEMLDWHPDAVAAEPFTPTIRQPSAPLTASEETAIRAWLALIEETDPVIVAEVIGKCQTDAEARGYFTGRAAAELPISQPAALVRCADCQHRIPTGYHPRLGHCRIGREAAAACGTFWSSDPRQCGDFIAADCLPSIDK